MRLALQLLTAIADESEVQLSRAARTAMLEALGERSDQVLHLLGAVLESFAGTSCTQPVLSGMLTSEEVETQLAPQLQFAAAHCALFLPAGQQTPMLQALRCFCAWLKLDVSGSGGALLTAGQLYARHQQLFAALLGALKLEDAAMLAEAAEGLTLLLGAHVLSC